MFPTYLRIEIDCFILAAKDVFEYPSHEIVGINLRRLLGSGQEGTWEVLARYASRPESGKYVESSAVSKSGKTIPLHISVSESVSGGKKSYNTIGASSIRSCRKSWTAWPGKKFRSPFC